MTCVLSNVGFIIFCRTETSSMKSCWVQAHDDLTWVRCHCSEWTVLQQLPFPLFFSFSLSPRTPPKNLKKSSLWDRSHGTWPRCWTQKAVTPQTPCGGEATFEFGLQAEDPVTSAAQMSCQLLRGWKEIRLSCQACINPPKSSTSHQQMPLK